jgi:3-deoxy-D-manno-octulosonic-acid transferase
MLSLYKILVFIATPVLYGLLLFRKINKKEDPKRIKERRGIPSVPCPKGHLIWIHAASVGEAQSALILIEKIQKIEAKIHFLITSGTVTSANLMAERLPKRAFHQYVPLDNPIWINRFLDHWQPDLIFWMESELWPCTLDSIKRRNIPTLLINARLSDNSFNKWKIAKNFAHKILSAFNIIITQTEKDTQRYKKLTTQKVITTDNIKYSAALLPCNETDLKNLNKAIGKRPFWVYASTHEGEETLACDLHEKLKIQYHDLLTIIVPRHPERREILQDIHPKATMRGPSKALPTSQTDIYIADTLGELGLFYRVSPIAMIGRSFSHDGGGGHNPIEAAQLDCAIMTGPNIQFQKEIFDALLNANAAIQVQTAKEFEKQLALLLRNDDLRKTYQENAKNFANSKNKAVDEVMEQIKLFIPREQKHV